MTTAPARAVSVVFTRNLRAALMAAASTGLLVSLAPGAQAASCATTAGNDTCVITLGNIADNHDGQAGTDKLEFNDPGNTINTTAANFKTVAGSKFLNFEQAEVVSGTTLNIVNNVLGDVPVSLAWTVGGILNVSGTEKNAIGDTSAMSLTATGRLNVLSTETVGMLSGAVGSIIDVAAGQVLAADGGPGATGSTFAGVIQGAGGFTKYGSGKLVLTGVNTFAGPLNVNNGTLEIGNANAIAGVGPVTVQGGALTSKGVVNYTINGPVTITTPLGSLSRITGNAIINGNLSSNGGLQPGNTAFVPPALTIENPGQDMGSIRINGDYTSTGTSAYVGMFIDIDAALAVNTIAGTVINPPTGSFTSPAASGTPGTTHDFLDIRGNITGTGRSMFSLASFTASPVGGATNGNGIQVIRITGTNSGNDFFQGSTLTAGPYQYVLRYVGNYNGAGDDGYFLQSATRDELIAHPALLSAGQALIRHCFRDDQRIPDSPKGATFGRGWVGYRQGSTSFGVDTGIDMDEDFSCSTGGLDWRMGSGWFAGVSGGFGSINGDLSTPAGVGTLDGRARVAEAYAAFTSSAFFFNISAGYADMDWTYMGAIRSLAGPPTATSSGFIGAAQAGLALGLEPVAVRLVGTLSYDGTDCGDSCFGLAVTEDTGLIEGKASLRFDGVTWSGSFRPWAAVSYSSVLSDGVNKVSMGAISVSADTNDELLSIDAGIHSYLDQNFALVVDGGYHESLAKEITGYRAGIGLKLYW